MTRVLYLIGPPGVGKSTALLGLAQPEGEAQRIPDTAGLWWVPSTTYADGWYLGKLRDAFPGTDALGYTVGREATAWATYGPLPAFLFGEGARLATVPFLGALAARAEVTVAWLTADDTALAARREGRVQNPTWVKGAETRANNVARKLAEAGVRVKHLETSAMGSAQVAGKLAAII